MAENLTAEQLAEISNPANSYLDKETASVGLTAEQLADISDPTNAYIENNVQSTESGLTADQLADLSDPSNAYREPAGLTPEEQNTFGIPPEAYIEKQPLASDPAPKPSNITEFNEQGEPAGKAPEPDLNKDTAALVQTGVYSNPGFFGDQQMTNSNQAFNKAVNLAVSAAGFASLLQSTRAPRNYVRTPTNYLLTEIEKQAIESKSRELSSSGFIPFDVIRKFFYILAALETQRELAYVGYVVGMPELDNPAFIRNIRGILGLGNIYKIQFLANGVASVISAFASKYNYAAAVANPYNSRIRELERSRDIALSLGVIGPILLSTVNNLNSGTNILRDAPNISNITANRAIDNLIGIAAGTYRGSLGAATNPTTNVKSIMTQVGVGALKGLLGVTPLGGALSSFGIMGPVAAGPLLAQFGGYAIGSYMSELLTGSRIPCQKIANNPTLRPPSYAGKAFFGETPCALPAVDQVFCRKIGSFGNPVGAVGTDSFTMQNYASFGGVLSISSVVSRMVLGSSFAPPAGSFMAQNVNNMVSNVCNVLNVPVTARIEMRRSDNAIPLMIGLSAAIAEEAFSPFGSKPISDGWKLASSAANDIQKSNPQYIEACRTSL